MVMDYKNKNKKIILNFKNLKKSQLILKYEEWLDKRMGKRRRNGNKS